jgi:Uracil DNA glycosylase superfamily
MSTTTGPGARARVPIVQESPGPGPKGSGAVGVLSPTKCDDPTARNLRTALERAGLDEDDCLFWNAVPWHVERGAVTRHLRLGAGYLAALVDLLPDLAVVVAMGRTAQADRRARSGRPAGAYGGDVALLQSGSQSGAWPAQRAGRRPGSGRAACPRCRPHGWGLNR